MNNALFQEEIEIDTSPVLRERKARLSRLVEAISNLSQNDDWNTLKELLLDGQVENLEKQLLGEAKNYELNSPKIYRLQGNLEWAKRYDFYKLAEAYKSEINAINKKLNSLSEA